MKLIKNATFIVTLFFVITMNAQELSFSEATANTKEITTRYFNDYMNLDFEAMKKQANDDISFNDTTANLIFGVELVEGKIQVFENFNKTYAAILEMKPKFIRTLFSSNVGVFEIELTYQFKADSDKIITIKKMPLIVVLTVKDGKINEHRDYGDYNHFLQQYTKQTKK
jgi:ketosteroid isomerase-like protein